MPSKAAIVGRTVIPLLILGICGFYIGSKLSSFIGFSMVTLYIQGVISPSTTLLAIGIPSLVGGLLLFIIGMIRLTRSYYNWITAGAFFISMALLSLGLNVLSDAAILAPLTLS